MQSAALYESLCFAQANWCHVVRHGAAPPPHAAWLPETRRARAWVVTAVHQGTLDSPTSAAGSRGVRKNPSALASAPRQPACRRALDTKGDHAVGSAAEGASLRPAGRRDPSTERLRRPAACCSWALRCLQAAGTQRAAPHAAPPPPSAARRCSLPPSAAGVCRARRPCPAAAGLGACSHGVVRAGARGLAPRGQGGRRGRWLARGRAPQVLPGEK